MSLRDTLKLAGHGRMWTFAQSNSPVQWEARVLDSYRMTILGTGFHTDPDQAAQRALQDAAKNGHRIAVTHQRADEQAQRTPPASLFASVASDGEM